MKSLSPLLRLYLLIFIWGFTGIAAKYIDVDAIPLVAYRMFFAALILGFFVYRKGKSIGLKIDRKTLLLCSLAGSLLGLNWLLFFHSIKISNVSITTAMLSSSTVLTALIEPLVFKRRINPSEIVLGLIVVVCVSLLFNAEIRYFWGIIAGFFCALSLSWLTVINALLNGRASNLLISFYEISIGLGVVVIAFFFSDLPITSFTNISWDNFLLILGLASIFTAFPLVESIDLMKHISPYTFMLTLNLEPVFSIILAHFIFPNTEVMTTSFYFIVLILIGAILANSLLKANTKRLKG